MIPKSKKWLPALLFFVATTLCFNAHAQDKFSPNPQKSFFIGVAAGAGLDLKTGTRSPYDSIYKRNVEAYSLGGFLLRIYGGYRFNEAVGIETGWQELSLDVPPEWGGGAYYTLGHLAGRVSFALPTRQTPVLKAGAAAGTFVYGARFITKDKLFSPMVGGYLALALEHELFLGMVGVLEVSYLPLYRFGMDDELVLWLDRNDDGFFDEEDETIDRKDFSQGEMVHMMWISFSVQFEWTFR